MTTISITAHLPAPRARRRFSNSRRAWAWRIAFLAVAAALVGGVLVENSLAYAQPHEEPGPAVPVTYVQPAPDPTFGSTGKWLTVSVSESAYPISSFLGRLGLSRTRAATGADALGASISVIDAWDVAYHLATRTPADSGLLVETIHRGFAQQADLHDSDVLVSIGAIPTPTIGALAQVAAAYQGTQQPVVVLRHDTRVVTWGMVPANESSQWGFAVTGYAGTEAPPLMPVSDGAGGGSAGLLYTLAYIDALTPGDLTGGMNVAATGLIAPDGAVGDIAGAALKIRGAQSQHPDVLFAPAGLNATDAADAGTRTTVVPVGNVQDAISWLCAHGGTSTVCPSDQAMG